MARICARDRRGFEEPAAKDDDAPDVAAAADAAAVPTAERGPEDAKERGWGLAAVDDALVDIAVAAVVAQAIEARRNERTSTPCEAPPPAPPTAEA